MCAESGRYGGCVLCGRSWGLVHFQSRVFRGGDGASSHMTVQALDGSMSAEYLHRFRSGHDLTIETGSEPGQEVVEVVLL